MKGLVQKGRKYAFQAAIPEDVRESFDGKKKFSATFNTLDPREAERLAAEADREFKARVLQIRQAALTGEQIDPARKHQIVGWLFGQFFNRAQDDRYFDLRADLKGVIVEEQHEGFPLVQGLHTEGVFFDELVSQVETLLEWAEGSSYARAFN